MSQLEKIRRGKLSRPFSMFVYGVAGVGKTSFAAQAPEPLFLDIEQGSAQLDVARTEAPEKLRDVYELIEELRKEKGAGFRTLVVDTVDHLNPLVAAHVCSRAGWESLDAPGYGKGPNAALAEWRKLMAAFEKLRSDAGMNLIYVGHMETKRFSNPDGDDYDRYQPNLPNKVGNLIKEVVDVVLFAEHEVATEKAKGSFKTKGVSTGRRVVRTMMSAACDAKNRHALEPTMELDWSKISRAMDVDGRFEKMLAGMSSEEKQRALKWFGEQPDKNKAMLQLLERKEKVANG